MTQAHIIKKFILSILLWINQEEPPEDPDDPVPHEEKQPKGGKDPKKPQLYRINWDNGKVEPYDPFE